MRVWDSGNELVQMGGLDVVVRFQIRWLLLAAMLAASGCLELRGSVELHAISGQVVDAETGEPVAGAVVVAALPLFAREGSNWHEGDYYGQRTDLSVREAVTDADGRFVIAAETVLSPRNGLLMSSNGVQLAIYSPDHAFALFNDVVRYDKEHFGAVPAEIRSKRDGEVFHISRRSLPDDFSLQKLQSYVRGRALARTLPCRLAKMPELDAALTPADREGLVDFVYECRQGGVAQQIPWKLEDVVVMPPPAVDIQAEEAQVDDGS